MKKILLTLVSAIVCYCTYAQNTYPYPSTGNIGIGIATAPQPITIQNDAADLRLQSATAPTGYYTDIVNNYNASYPFYINTNNYGRFGFKQIGINASSSAFISGYAGIGFATGTTDPTSANIKMAILQNGKVGIGTIAPGAQFDVYQVGTGSGIRVGGGSAMSSNNAGIDLYAANGSSIPVYARVALGVDYGGVGGEIGNLNFSTINAGSLTEKLRITGAGNVGIGITNPAGLLSLNNQIPIGTDPINYAATSTPGQTVFNSYYAVNTDGYGGYPRYLDIASVGAPNGSTGGGNIRFLTNPVAASSPAIERMRIASNGNVIIGTPFIPSNPAYLLNVSGFVRANEVVVNTTGADFVFNPSYRLNSLSDLKKYIDHNHHLPEIASAKQMRADGLKVGENETKLLQKVEELTLYLIESDKKEKEQQTQLDEQNQKILDQGQRIKLLEAKLDLLLKK